MTLKYLLDTSIVSIPTTAAPNQRTIRFLEERAMQCAIAAPVLQELTFGWMRLPKGKRKAAVEAYLEDVIGRVFSVLPYDGFAATWHGVERARLEKEGKTPPFVDGQIAAIACTNSLILVTANTKDFVNFTDLQLEDWSK